MKAPAHIHPSNAALHPAAGFCAICCVVWAGILFGGLTVGGILLRWAFEKLL